MLGTQCTFVINTLLFTMLMRTAIVNIIILQMGEIQAGKGSKWLSHSYVKPRSPPLTLNTMAGQSCPAWREMWVCLERLPRHSQMGMLGYNSTRSSRLPPTAENLSASSSESGKSWEARNHGAESILWCYFRYHGTSSPRMGMWRGLHGWRRCARGGVLSATRAPRILSSFWLTTTGTVLSPLLAFLHGVYRSRVWI